MNAAENSALMPFFAFLERKLILCKVFSHVFISVLIFGNHQAKHISTQEMLNKMYFPFTDLLVLNLFDIYIILCMVSRT